MSEIEFAKRLSDEEVLLLLKRSARDERAVTARLLVHFGEVDERGLFRDEGYSSMFAYAVGALHMSEPEAALRIRAARLVRKFPEALKMLTRGELHLTAICLLAPVLTADTAETLLRLARHKSKLEVQELIAKHFPQPDVRSEVRKLPTPSQSAFTASRGCDAIAHPESHPLAGLNCDPVLQSPDAVVDHVAVPLAEGRLQRAGDASNLHMSEPTRPGAQPRGSRASVPVPLSEGRYKVQFTARKAFTDKLEHAKALLCREVSAGDLEAIFERALDLLIADREKKMFGVTAKPRPVQSKSASERPNARYVPRELRRTVYQRDNGRCAFTASNGTRCGARDRLELHHIVAFALGGPMSAENIELRCRAHNVLEAERDFGRDRVKKRIRDRRLAAESLRQPKSSQQAGTPTLQFPDAAQTSITQEADACP